MYDNDFWPRVRALQKELEQQHPNGEIWLHILKDAPFCTCTSPAIAARHLIDGTCRRATAGDMARHEAHTNDAARRAAARQQLNGRRRDIALLR